MNKPGETLPGLFVETLLCVTFAADMRIFFSLGIRRPSVEWGADDLLLGKIEVFVDFMTHLREEWEWGKSELLLLLPFSIMPRMNPTSFRIALFYSRPDHQGKPSLLRPAHIGAASEIITQYPVRDSMARGQARSSSVLRQLAKRISEGWVNRKVVPHRFWHLAVETAVSPASSIAGREQGWCDPNCPYSLLENI